MTEKKLRARGKDVVLPSGPWRVQTCSSCHNEYDILGEEPEEWKGRCPDCVVVREELDNFEKNKATYTFDPRYSGKFLGILFGKVKTTGPTFESVSEQMREFQNQPYIIVFAGERGAKHFRSPRVKRKRGEK